MKIDTPTEPAAVTETRLTHDVHRRATTLLAEAAVRPSVPLGALAQLRDFLVANLRHHHESEDEVLWPLIITAAPYVKQSFDQLSGEHKRLDEALDALSAIDLSEPDEAAGASAGRTALHVAAVAVRNVVHDHLAREEPVLFPVLRKDISPAVWQQFAQQVIATAPPVAGHLMIGFLDEVGTPAEVELVLAGLPGPLHPLVPAMRQQAQSDLRVLQPTGS